MQYPYSSDKAKLVVKEMADLMALELVEKGLLTDQMVLTVGYDVENLRGETDFDGEIKRDAYGRKIPKHAHGTANLEGPTSSTAQILAAVSQLYDRIIDKTLLIRRLNITANHVVPETPGMQTVTKYEQLDLFTDYSALEEERERKRMELAREKKMQQVMLTIKKKFGKNAILKGMNLEEGATARDRNAQIGGHKA